MVSPSLLMNIAYLAATALFIFGLKKLGSPASARQGNRLSALGMFIAIIGTLYGSGIIDFHWILIGTIIGSVAGIAGARLVAMTAMPEMVALLNGFGGISSLLLGWASYAHATSFTIFSAATTAVAVLIGGVTFSGSLLAWGKLSERLGSRPFALPFQTVLNGLLLLSIIVLSVIFILDPATSETVFYVIIGLSLLLGIFSVMAIGGGDMPVVIALLNSYSGLAASAAGFVIQNTLLIVAGALVGASGMILTVIMCKAMNRSLSNVLFSGFGSENSSSGAATVQGEAKPVSCDDAYYVLEAARSVVIVPGYGLAVAQAQHVVKELGGLMEANGAEVRYAIHPVAGRMPGHMNVLLAEADVPYDQLIEMDDINSIMDTVDVCIVIGANDVVNPDATDNDASPIYGMPIINAHHAQTVYVLKRSMGTGFAGIQNPLFFKENTRMIFGDAKETIQGLIRSFKS